MAAMTFSRLAQVEVQIVMQHCDKITLLRLALCSRTTLAAASHRFAWRSLSPIPVQCDSPLELSSRVSASLLRRADLSVRWPMLFASNTANSNGTESGAGGATAEQRAAAETAALVALPGLCRLQVLGRSADVARACSALLARLDDGVALADLHLNLFDELRHADCEALGALVARSHTLTALRTGGQLDSGAFRCLADGMRQSQSLATLSLSRMNLGAEAAKALVAAVAHCPSLTDLQLLECGINNAAVEALVGALENKDSIRTLGLRGNRLRRKGTAAVARLLASDGCAIERLDLYGCDIGEAGAKSLAAALRTNRTLTQLQLDACYVETEGTAALTAAMHHNAHIPLRHLDLSSNQVNAAGAALLAAFMRTHSTLEELHLRNCNLDDAAVAALAAGLPAAHSLRQLRLGQSTFGLEGASALAAQLGACPSLMLLDVIGVRIGDGGMGALAPALGHLRVFDARHCGLTGDSAASLLVLLQSGRQLHTLILDGNRIGTAAVVGLTEALHSHSRLRILHLEQCDVDAEAAAALGEALARGWAATDLNLGYNHQVGDAGARALALALEQCAGRCSLSTLSLNSCQLSLAGAQSLVRAASLAPSLRSLSLSSNFSIGTAELLAARGPEARFQLQ